MSHQFEEAMVSCQDPRLNKIHHQLIEQRGMVGKTDTIFFGNPVLDLVNGHHPEVLKFILGKFQIAIVSHGVKVVRLYNHFNCGAYELANYEFKSPLEEEKFLVSHLVEAASILRKHFGKDFKLSLYLLEQIDSEQWGERLLIEDYA